MARKISVSDITMKLTDGKIGSSLSFRKKIELSKMLDRLGVSVIETGPVVNVKEDCLLVKSLASAIKDSTLAVPVDITNPDSVDQTWPALKTAKHPRLQVELPVSTVQMEYICHKKPAAVLQLASELVAAAAAKCPDVEFVAGDAGRADADFLAQIISAAVSAGATVVTVCDTAGDMFSDEFSASVKAVKALLPANVKLGVIISNDMYLADANAIAAIYAGADEIKTMPFDSLTVSLKRFVRILNVKSSLLKASCDVKDTEVQRMSQQIKNLCVAAKTNSFASALGISSDTPEISLTIHDDRKAVLEAVSKLGYDLSDEDADNVFEAFVRLASKNEIIEAKELDAIVATAAFQAPPTYRLESYVINSGNTISATCHLRLKKEQALLESVCVGDGPVDAAFQAIEKLVDRQYELDDFQIRSVTEGREAMGEAVVRLRYAGKVFSGSGISTDIVGSSIMAYLNAVNKIEFEEE